MQILLFTLECEILQSCFCVVCMQILLFTYTLACEIVQSCFGVVCMQILLFTLKVTYHPVYHIV